MTQPGDAHPGRRGWDSNPRGSLTRPHDFQSCTLSRSVTSPGDPPALASEAELANPALAPAQVVRQLVAEGPLDLGAQDVRVVSEVPLERVLVDDDPVGVVVARHGVAEVVAVGAVLGAALDTTTGVRSSSRWKSSGSASIASATSRSNSSVVRAQVGLAGELLAARTSRSNS